MTLTRAFPSLALVAALSFPGCSWLADVSSTMRVDTGLEPENIDTNVRFRTTYYFRVLTGCTVLPKTDGAYDSSSPFAKRISGTFIPLHDSLYRFRMTGQAAALLNTVHFESGVLRKEQIDPFGSTVRYDEKAHTISLVSPNKATGTALYEVEQFRALYKDISRDSTLSVEHRNQLLTELIAVIEDRLKQIETSRPQGGVPTDPATGRAPSEAELITLETQLGNTETELGTAKNQLGEAQKALQTAKETVDKISKSVNEAKQALVKKPETEEDESQIAALTEELSTAQAALTTAEERRTDAAKQVNALTTTATTAKDKISQLRNNLTVQKSDTITALGNLSQKIHALLTELGQQLSPAPASNATPCNAKPSANKYYLLGPEGAKELDPNDRLLLALSVDSKPLISALQQLSERKLQAASTNIKTVEDLLEERGRILDAKTLLMKAATDAEKAAGPSDESKLETVLEALRKPYVTDTPSTPAK